MGCVCGRPSSAFDDGQRRATPPPPGKLSAAVRREEEARKQQQRQHARAGSGREEAMERRRAMMAMAAACQVRSPVPRVVEAEQVAAGWPPWLVAVAPEAVRGWVPRRAESFEKLDKIGQGTYSNVYRARDLEKEKIVALKKVRFDNLEPESVKFMAREILILRRLDHPNVIKLEGLVTSRMSCSLYLVFEYMEHDLAGLASFPGVKFTESQFFTTKPYACNPSSLPRYPPSKEFDAKRREEEARRQGVAGGKQHKHDPERRTRESRAVPAPDANAELVSSLQKRQAQANTRSRSEMFNPCKEDSASGFRIEPPRPTPVTESSEDSQRAYPTRILHSGPLVNQNQASKGGGVKNGDIQVPGAVNHLVVASTRSSLRSDDSSRTMVVQAEALAHGRRLSESINEHFNNSGKYDQVFPKKDDRSSRADGAIGYGSKGNKIHHSGPLICPSGNVDEMLKENDRQIQEVFRRTRVKSRARRDHGHHQGGGIRPGDFGAIPVFPSSRSSYQAVQQSGA
nr:unnamed protein product [Digitaria exilis]